MNPNNFYILGETDEEGNASYWHNTNRWTYYKGHATVFGEEILTLPPPEGATGIIEENQEGLPVNFYGVPPFPEGSVRY